MPSPGDPFLLSKPTYYYLEQGYTFRIDKETIDEKTYYHSVIVDCDTSKSGNVKIPDKLGNTTVKILEGAVFSGCNKITGVEIGENIRSIDYSAFNNCSALEKIDISKNNQYYTSIDGVLFDKSCETLIQYPRAKKTLKYAIPQGVVTIVSGAMNSCDNLRNVEIPSSVSDYSTSIFSNCKQLRNIMVDKGNSVLYSVDGVLFERWSNTLLRYPSGKTATKYKVPDGTEVIAASAFVPCTTIAKIEFPESLTEIKAWAFSGKNIFSKGSITEVIYAGSPDRWKIIKISAGNTCITSAALTCLKENNDSSYMETYKEWQKLSTDTDSYIGEHAAFVKSDMINVLKNNRSFYTQVWQEENGRRMLPSVIWKVVGDVGEVMSFKFNDLTVNASFYDLFVADLVLAMNNVEKTDKFSVTIADTYKKYYGGITNLFKSTDEWEKSISDGVALDVEVEGLLTKPGYKISENTEKILSNVLKDVFKNHRDGFTKIFKYANSANKLCGHISTASDVVNAFKKGYDTYIIVETFKTLDEDFYKICDLIAASLYDVKPGYANQFLKSVNKYKTYAMNDAAMFDMLLTQNVELLNVAYELTLKDVLKNISYNIVAKMLNCSTAAIGAIGATYNFTYSILNKALKLGSKTDYYSLMNYVAPIEKALSTIVSNKAKIFSADAAYDRENAYNSAKTFDLSYNMWRCTNMYLYECAYNFLSAQKIRDEMALATQYKEHWNRIKCHKDLTTVTNKKLVTVNCPVDVFVYDSNKQVVLSIENEIVTQRNDKISLMLSDGKKMFSYPADEEYFIDIKARETGTMDYFISEIQNDVIVRTIEFYDLELEPNSIYSGSIPYEFGMDNIEYQLIMDKNEVLCDYDSSIDNDCDINGHTFGDWIYVPSKNTNELDCEQRICSVCGKTEERTVHNEHKNLLVGNYMQATCTSEGYSGDTYCALCGEIVEKGNPIPKINHKFSVEKKLPTCTQDGSNAYTCEICSYTYTETVTKTGHTDSDKNGICDTCGEEIEHDQPSDPSKDCTCMCHKTGFIGFIYKIIRIFWKIFKINKTCSCGAAHY